MILKISFKKERMNWDMIANSFLSFIKKRKVSKIQLIKFQI